MIRVRESSSKTVYAGSVAELAAVAMEYADGHRKIPDGTARRHFEDVSARLLAGYVAESAGVVEFWQDHADGSPFEGPAGFRPDPDPEWKTSPRATAAQTSADARTLRE